MTNEDKIIQLFHSGQYELAYTLRDSLNVEMDYSKIDLPKMVKMVGVGTSLNIPNKNGKLTVEIVTNLDKTRLHWIEFFHDDNDFLLKQYEILRNEFDVTPNLAGDVAGDYEGPTFFFYEEPNCNETLIKLLKFIFEYE